MTKMKLVSWNVNSIKARTEHVQRFLKESNPDVLMLQELKGIDCPAASFEGHNCESVTQKSYNGVSIISKHPINVIHRALPGNGNDEQARYIEADINGIRVINIYLPNGNPVEDGQSEKFLYKLNWMNRLIARVKQLRESKTPFVIGGDFNIIPATLDAMNIKEWIGDALHHTESLSKWRTLLNLGLYDTYRIIDKSGEKFTFWDYQAGAWQKNNGIRIDHFLTCPELTDKIEKCEIDKEPRGWERPSDHTPIALTLSGL
jgi:exodeoxyribonuclease-3